MRIGMMVDVYKPHVSGITNYISLNKFYMESHGHEVFVFVIGDQDYTDDEANIIRSPGLPLVDTGYYLGLNYSRRAKALLQTMDIVHVHHPFLSGRLALRYCHPLHIPIVFTNHTRYDLYAQAYLPLLPEEISDSLLEAYMPSFCDALDMVISPSKGMADVLYNLGVKRKIEIIPNGVDLKRYYEVDEPCKKEECGFNPDDILLVYVGRLGPEKNLPFLVQAFAGAAEAVKEIHLLIVGDGSEYDALQKLASQTSVSRRIHFTGMMEYTHLPVFLAMCDAFVTTSITEVHPLSVIEAMAAGLPVLGVQSVGVGDTVVDGVTGFLARENEAAFAALMTRLCLDSSLRQKMGHAARMEAQKYDIGRTTELLLSHYKRLVFDSVPRQRSLGVRLRAWMEKWKT